MPDEPSHDLIHGEQRELDALRRRAYGPDADIFDDPVAVARLTALEDLVRGERAPREDETVTAESDRAARSVGSAPVVSATLRDAPLLLIGEGTSEIQRMVIGRTLLRRHKL